VALGFIFYNKINAFFAGELASARLFGIEMIKTCFPRKYLAVFRKFQSFAV
jgi:hypothetical protein